ncbi:MAG TPA: hypothetical protein VGN32_03495 [Ktedonobacterales bacterium]|nr:hypothetical protein [Ktedonobacterales bacterium]
MTLTTAYGTAPDPAALALGLSAGLVHCRRACWLACSPYAD